MKSTMAALAAMLMTVGFGQAVDDSVWAALFDQQRELREVGSYKEASRVAQLAVTEAERFGPSDARLGITANEAGWLSQALGQFREAEKLFLRAARILEHHSDEQLSLASTLNNLSMLYLDFGGRYAEAEQLQRRALALSIAVQGPRNPGVATLLANLGAIRSVRGDIKQARFLYEEALEFPVDNEPNALKSRASALSNLAALCYQTGDRERALAYVSQAISVYEKVVGRDHPDLVAPLANQGLLYVKLGRASLAETSLHRARAIVESTLGPQHPTMAIVLSRLAKARRQAGEKKEARELERQAQFIDAHSRDQALARIRIHVSDLIDEYSLRRGHPISSR